MKKEISEYRIVFIGLCVVLMAASIFLVAESLSQERSGLSNEFLAKDDSGTETVFPDIAQEKEVFALAGKAIQLGMQTTYSSRERTLSNFYKRRAYPGAPPKIPHEVQPDMAGGNNCLTCHDNGGYVAKFSAYTPLTPHPGMENCRQCHVPETTETLFQETDWKTFDPPEIGRSALHGSPPPIPHSLQLRENCLACHGGAAAVREIRSSHPERINCRQCHVKQNSPHQFTVKRS